MNDDIKHLSEARQKKGWTDEEIEQFVKRRSRELKEIVNDIKEPDYLASGTKVPLEKEDKGDINE